MEDEDQGRNMYETNHDGQGELYSYKELKELSYISIKDKHG